MCTRNIHEAGELLAGLGYLSLPGEEGGDDKS